MRKIIIFVLIFVVIAVIGYFVWTFYGRQSSPSVQQPTGTLPEVSSKTPPPLPSSTYSIKDNFPADATIKIGTATGVVETKNFYKTAVDTEEGSIIMKQSDDYTISYNRQTSNFLLNVFTSSSTEMINLAETDLLNILGIGQHDACKLDVRVLRPGQNDGTRLSFCPNQVK